MDSGDEDEMSMAERDFERMTASLQKSGYRDGIGKGETDNLQKYTDQSRVICQAHFEAIGDLQGLLLIYLCQCIEANAPSQLDTGALETLLNELKAYVEALPISGLAYADQTPPPDSTFTEFLETKSLVFKINFEKFKKKVCEVLHLSSKDYDEHMQKFHCTKEPGVEN